MAAVNKGEYRSEGQMYDIQRICVKAKPSSDNTEYFEWQTASICMFVPENDKSLAVQKAREELRRRNWDFIAYEDKSTLIEGRVRQAEEDVRAAYEYAKQGNIFFKVFSDSFCAGDKEIIHILPARISENFMDKVVADAGGHRLPIQKNLQGVKSADYLVGNFVFELKDLQEEVLEKAVHQKKLAALFQKYYPGKSEVVINPSVLAKSDYREYLNILSRPIKTQIRSASRQIKASKELLGRSDLNGGIIFLNTGLGSLQHEAFAAQVERFALKDSSQYSAVVSISVYCHTNGFDAYILHYFSPEKPDQGEVAGLRKAFAGRFEDMMTDLVRGKIPDSMERALPSKSLTFNDAGIDFAWIAPRVPLSIRKDKKD